jgi:hypothetical protein
LAAGSLTKITLRFDLGIFVVDAPRRLDAGRCNGACHPLPVTLTQAEETPALPEHSPRPPIPVCTRPAPWRDPASTRTWRFEPAKVLLTPSWLPQEFSSNIGCFP